MPVLNHIKNVEPFKNLPEEISELLRDKCKSKTYPENHIVFSQYDEPTGYLYFIDKGLVEIFSETNEGVEIAVDYRSEGEYFGWTPIFASENYSAGARTLKETECLLIPKELILEIARKYPIVSNYFNKAAFSRIRKLYKEVVKSHDIDHSIHTDAYPFQKKVSEIMTPEPVAVSPETTAGEIAAIMTEKGISSVLIYDDSENLTGIVTERDLVTKIMAREDDKCLKTIKAKEFMTNDPYYVNSNEYMYEAAAFMLRHNIRHLPVLNNNKITGIISIRDLMRFRSQKSVFLVGKAKEANSVENLKRIKEEIVSIAKALLVENRSHVETMEIISYIHHNIIRRCFELIYDEMIKEGYKDPEINYCFMIMGSGGRKEMHLGPDQDNGLIFENYPKEKEQQVLDFFIPLSERLTKALAYIGYPLCKGGVMVSNPKWRGNLDEWKDRVALWIKTPEPQRVRYSSIFFDFFPLIGDSTLLNNLKNFILKTIQDDMLFLYQMMQLDFKHKVPFGFLGRFVTSTEEEHKGKLSVKENGSIFIVDCVRMYMLKHNTYANTTLERLDKLVEKKVFNKATAEHIKAAFEYFTYIRLKNEIKLIEQGKKPDHYLDPYELPKNEQELLKEAFKVADKLQDSTKRHFSKIIGM